MDDPQDICRAVGRRLREAREQRGWSLMATAGLAGVSEYRLMLAEDRGQIRLVDLLALLAAFGLRPGSTLRRWLAGDGATATTIGH